MVKATLRAVAILIVCQATTAFGFDAWFDNSASSGTGVFAATAARREVLALVDTDVYMGQSRIDIMRDANGNCLGLVFVDPMGAESSYTLAQLQQGYQVAKSYEGYDAILLAVDPAFDPAAGGYATIRFLYDGTGFVFGGAVEYRNFRVRVQVGASVELVSEPDSMDPDSDRNPYTGRFNHMYLRKNTLFGRTIGILDITPSVR